MTAIKICGITQLDDACAAAEAGASFVGFVLWAGSPRHVPLERVRAIVDQLPKAVLPVGVFVDPAAEEIDAAAAAGIQVAQIHGGAGTWARGIRPDVTVVRAVHLAERDGEIEPQWPAGKILLDAHDPVKHGGTGRTIDWSRARLIAGARQVFLAGGLTPFNVADAVRAVRPFAVDVSSGVEHRPGVKDHAKVRAFVAAVRTTGTIRTEGTDE
jgi:phosphoribosylanthranilate isomerase